MYPLLLLVQIGSGLSLVRPLRKPSSPGSPSLMASRFRSGWRMQWYASAGPPNRRTGRPHGSSRSKHSFLGPGRPDEQLVYSSSVCSGEAALERLWLSN
ncbi:uncharacterized protein B0T23DRAFT_384925 [Neurospora hispaniola]|uniref:Uncharacterized protein n=1 Tax=Neurospora hispaniola TaxID=588809 RepID=A0AAJ0I440_9PEZI|nr:hypothetical protein B0T23DRAFT_384925 [Neurospora hispaniola]